MDALGDLEAAELRAAVFLELPVAGELLFCPYFLGISLPATILR